MYSDKIMKLYSKKSIYGNEDSRERLYSEKRIYEKSYTREWE